MWRCWRGNITAACRPGLCPLDHTLCTPTRRDGRMRSAADACRTGRTSAHLAGSRCRAHHECTGRIGTLAYGLQWNRTRRRRASNSETGRRESHMCRQCSAAPESKLQHTTPRRPCGSAMDKIPLLQSSPERQMVLEQRCSTWTTCMTALLPPVVSTLASAAHTTPAGGSGSGHWSSQTPDHTRSSGHVQDFGHGSETRKLHCTYRTGSLSEWINGKTHTSSLARCSATAGAVNLPPHTADHDGRGRATRRCRHPSHRPARTSCS